MKTKNGTKLLIAIILFGVSTASLAQEPTERKSFQDRIIKNALVAMNHELPSMVESSLFVVIEVKNKFPNEDYRKIIDKLNDLAENGKTMSIRYKAQLASLYYKYQDEFKEIDFKQVDNPDKCFKMISGKVETNSFAIN